MILRDMVLQLGEAEAYDAKEYANGVVEFKMREVTGRTCCYVPDQSDLKSLCNKPAEFQVWYGYEPTVDDYTECCGEHLADVLRCDHTMRFEVVRME
jgi:hypothetical protein